MPRHQAEQRLGLERLDQIVDSSLTHSFDGPLNRRMSGHQQYRELRVVAAQLSQQLMTIHAWHVHIAHHQTERLFGHRQQGVFGTANGTVAETTDLQGIDQRLAQDSIILHQQNLDAH